METIIAPKWNMLSVGAFLSCMLASAWIAQTPSSDLVTAELPKLHIQTQIVHAKELLNRAPQSLERSGDIELSGREFIYRVLDNNLPSDYRWQAALIAHALIEEANRYDLDPVFLLAVIQTESHFNPRALGHFGDRGLMQLLPKTGAWMGRRLHMPAPVDLFDPITNIRIGAAYIAHLRQHFHRLGSRYLAAYNMGTRNVHKLLNKDVEPMIYARRVLKNYRALYAEFAASLPAQQPRTLVSLNN